jgi:hypothetical protein
MKLPKSKLKLLLVVVSLVCIIAVFFLKPIPQDNNFHHFADTRNIFTIENFWNVASNLFFLLIGVAGVQKLRLNKLILVKEIKAAYYIFFIAVMLVAVGSAWYHYHPGNDTLVWDRLPMTMAFMSLLSIALVEFVSVTIGRIGLIPFLLAGIGSIAWWQYGELHHHGDLRPYALVQFLPIILLTLLFLFGEPVFNRWGYIALFVCYLLAKLAEHFDVAIYNLTSGLIAGHLIKHIITAVGLWLFLLYLQKRKPVKAF